MVPGAYREYRAEFPSRRLAGAFLISLLAHCAFLGLAHMGNRLGWWESQPFSMFRKVRLSPEEIARIQEEQRRLMEQRMAQEEPLIFVQVTQPSDEAPTDTPFYSAASSKAANPDPGNSDQPQIDGRQTQTIRLEDAPSVPLASPSPTVASSEPEADSAPLQLAESPAVEPVVQADLPEVLPPPEEPERQQGIGELAMIQPEVVPPPTVPTRVEPVPQRGTRLDDVQPVPQRRQRPRTVVEAKLRQELLAGEKTKLDGGVARPGPVQLEVQGKEFGAYDLALVAAVQNRWFALLAERRFAGEATGRVVINFKLYSDGTVRIVEPTESTVDALLEAICVRAVRDPAPFEPWPAAMLREIGRNFREIRFTFFYN